MKKIMKILLAVGIIAFSASITATSCNKKDGDDGNNPAPSTNLTLWSQSEDKSFVKVSGNTVYVNASGLSAQETKQSEPHSAAEDKDRGFANAGHKAKYLFYVSFPGTSETAPLGTSETAATLIFVNRAHVTKDTIVLKDMPESSSFPIPPGSPRTPPNDDCKIGSESIENNFAKLAEGAHCRYLTIAANSDGTPYNVISARSYLGTLFDNTDATKARGTMLCGTDLVRNEEITDSNGNRKRGVTTVINDTTLFNAYASAGCRLAMVNNGLGSAVEIDDAWVADSKSTTEVELYAIGISVAGKPIPKWSDTPGYGLSEFKKPHDNAAFKKLLRNNKWGELKFKVKIIKSADFTALP